MMIFGVPLPVAGNAAWIPRTERGRVLTDRTCQVAGLIRDVADENGRDDQDADQDPRAGAGKLRPERFAKSHAGDDSQTCCHGLHDDNRNN